MLTAKQRLEYIFAEGSACPHCGSTDIVGDSWEHTVGRVWQKVSCQECEQEWVDTYTLSDVGTVIREPDQETEPDMATARELRDALDKLLNIFDEEAAAGRDDWEDDERVKGARQTLGKGL
jgi:hypothetical protein